MSDALLTMSDLSIAFPGAEGEYFPAVNGVSLSVAAGEVLGIAGESGSGKTLTALSILGLLPHGARTTGQVLVDGVDVLSLKGSALRSLRLAQNPTTR